IWLQQRTDEELLRRFDELLLDKEPSEGLAVMYLTKARYAFGAGRYEESGEWAEKMSEIARAVGSDYILAEAEARRGTAVAYHDIAQGIAILEEAAMLAERTGNSSALGLSLNNVAFEYMLRGDLQRNLRYRTRALEQAQKVQSPTAQAWGNAMMAQAHHYLGDLEKAREHAEIAVRSVRVMERIWHTSYALYVLAHVKVLAGEVDDAAALIQEGQEIARSHSDLQGMGYGRSIGGELSLLRGEPEKVISMYESVPTADIVSFESWVAAEAYLAVGKADIAEQIAGEMIQPDSWFRSEGLRIRGMIAAGRARYDEAENDFSSAMELARTQGYRVEEGRSLYEYGRMLATRGDRDAARKCFGQALRLFREIGAHAYADRTERAISELLAA
ncbi:MAG TPA: tetratricopeptide repeat protein, partial [Chloroflexota bacterium]